MASKRVDSLLSNYEAKLKELEDLLKQADNMVKKTSNQNNINTESFKDILVSIKNFTILKTCSVKRECTLSFFFFFFLKKRVNDLESERDLVGDQIALAVNQLKDTEGLLNMFNDSKKVNFHTYTPLGLGECYETQQKYFQVKVRLIYSLICFSN